MNYVTRADLGGQAGHGKVVPEPEGELFHAAWEPRVLAVTLAAGALGAWNIDMSRSARETLPATTEVRVWDSTAEMRYLVVPQRPKGTEGWSEEKLAGLVTRDSMIGTGLARAAQ